MKLIPSNNTDNVQIAQCMSTLPGKSSTAIPIPRSTALFNHNIQRPTNSIHQSKNWTGYPSDSTLRSSYTKTQTDNKYSYPTNGAFISPVLSRSMDFSKKCDIKNDMFNNNHHSTTTTLTPLNETSTSFRSSTSLDFDDDTKPSGVVVDDDFLPMSSPVDDDYWDSVSVETTIQCFPNVGSSPVIEVKHFETDLLTGEKIRKNYSITMNNSQQLSRKDSDDQHSETSEDYFDDDDDDDDVEENNINSYSIKEFALKELQKPIVLKSALKLSSQLDKMTELSSSDEFKMRSSQMNNDHLEINKKLLEKSPITNIQLTSHLKSNNSIPQHQQCSPLNKDYSNQMTIAKNSFVNKDKLNQEQNVTNNSSSPSSSGITKETENINISFDSTTDLNERLKSYLPPPKSSVSNEITDNDQIRLIDNEKLLKNISPKSSTNTNITTRLKVSSPPCSLYTSSRQTELLSESSTVRSPQTIYEEGEEELKQQGADFDNDDDDESAEDGEIDLEHEYELSQRLNGGLDDVCSSSIAWNTDDKMLTTDDMNKYYLMQKDDLLSLVTSSLPGSTVRSLSSDFISNTKPTPPSIMKTSKSIEHRTISDTLVLTEQASLVNIVSPNDSTSSLLQSPPIPTVMKPKVRFNLDPQYEREREWNKVNKLLGNVEWTDEFEV
ncbi:unnamed protein product [Didymodactylos carnosus]|nr:unnamed protein product [Didymodactylos carnosus]CAF4035473.1 unnamed protein product [Didymodactylos carnosus]